MEATLIAAAQAGDERAARALYERHAPRLHRVVGRWVSDAAAAEDLCQEAWVRAFRALSEFRGDAEFGTWLHTIARNLVASWSRRGRRREALAAERWVPSSTRPEPVELRIDLQRALADLPQGMRQVLWLHDVEGWKHRQIAGALGVAEGTSKSQLFKARARLREAMAPRSPASASTSPGPSIPSASSIPSGPSGSSGRLSSGPR